MKRQGFTLIELLVVIAIIGLLSTLAVVALGSARSKSRDARRMSDLRQIQTALELYYADAHTIAGEVVSNVYPVEAAAVTLGAGNYVCLNTDGWEATGCADPYMGLVPSDPTPSLASYDYTSADGSTYTIDAVLEGSINGMTGAVQASPSGIVDVAG